MIRIEQLVVRYPGQRSQAAPPPPAVDHLDLSVPDGRFYGFLGPNGAGKSTTLGAIMGLVAPTSGRVTVAGIDPQRDVARLRAQVGYVPQAIALHASLSVRENLTILGGLAGLSGRRLRGRVARAIADARLEGRERSRVASLSGGMQRRLNLVASLLHDPRLILCDEPTAGVDPQSRLYIYEMLRALHQDGRTVLYTTHYMEEVEALCSHVAILDHGRLVAEGALADMLSGEAGTSEHTVVLGDDALVRGRADAAAALRAALEGAGIVVAEVRPQKKSLEDVFLALTGRALRDEE